MKRLILFICFAAVPFLLCAVCTAQTSSFSGTEPDQSELGAPLYPGAVYIRTVSGLDPYHETAMYITLDRMKIVEVFFERKLSEKHKVYYEDENRYMTIFLLKTWSTFSGNPKKEELSRLEHEPNIQIYEYDRGLFESMAEFYERKPDEKIKADAIRTGWTLIRYTYKRTYKNKNAEKIIGAWISTDRDLPEYYKSVITFDSDGTYSHTFTKDNVSALAGKFSSDRRFAGKGKEEIEAEIFKLNPEKGSYVIMRNTITLVSNNPVIEPETKSGIARVGTSLLSLDIINQPRLSFLRVYSEK